MDLDIRTKPTKHRQICLYSLCEDKDMKKGEKQVVITQRPFGRSRFTLSSYYHPICALLDFLSRKPFIKYFTKRYGELEAKSLFKVYKSNVWRNYIPYYTYFPFKILDLLLEGKTEGEQIAFIEDVFLQLAFKKVFGNG